MKKLSILFAFIICLTACETTKKPVINAEKNAKGNLVGLANKESFNQAPYSSWFNRNYDNFTPDATVVSEIKKNLKGVTIKGFMGTWCGDSKRETPKFYKILDQVGFNQDKVELATVNRSKKTPDNLQEGLDIIKVPTFIFYKKGKEIGRFVEYPRETIEKDILKIVSGQDYKHSYAK
ncbi:thiol reductase thioredoxin [Tenacibaculum todarodis]|uniref:Thiol reductase thioredoxin n=1 Tax=Tenacibaculum todarodis TaxID=1850252 RepID=A0A1L3JMZ5_9FLAO|nr:thioredoxin family protein [Tenacibaculum todarodis]APG66462.1 thiol reductase thioredoxin [Tenacibaculum todarodis]